MNKDTKLYFYTARLYACIAAIEGMKAENTQRAYSCESMAYNDEAFFMVGEELSEIIELFKGLED